MKAIAATTEAKSIDPGLSLRAEQGVAGPGFYQIFSLAGSEFPEAVIAEGEEGSLDDGEDRTSSDFSVLASIEVNRIQAAPSPLDMQVLDGTVVNSDQSQLQAISLGFAGSTDEVSTPWLAPVGAKISAVYSGGLTKLDAVLIDPPIMQNIMVTKHPSIVEELLVVKTTVDAARDCQYSLGQTALLGGELGQDITLPDYAPAAHITAKSSIHPADASQQVSLTKAQQVDLALLPELSSDDLDNLMQRAVVMLREMGSASMQAEHSPDLDVPSFQKPGEDKMPATHARSPMLEKTGSPMWPNSDQDSLLLAQLAQSCEPEGLQPADKGGNRLNLAIAATGVVSALAGMPAKQDASGRSEGPTLEKSAVRFAVEAASRTQSFQPDLIKAANEGAEGVSFVSSGVRAPVINAQQPAPFTATLPLSATLNMRQADWGKQLIGHIERTVASGSQRIELSLRPKNLGEIHVLIGMRGEQTTVQIMTETAAAARLLHGGEDRLAQILDQSGYRLSGFSAQEYGSGSLGGQQGQHRHSSSRRNRTLVEAAQREETSEAVATITYQAGRSPGSGINMIA
jgi:flagellar hook-length control protein FliK